MVLGLTTVTRANMDHVQTYKALDGSTQLLVLLAGPAGAGKRTSVKAVEICYIQLYVSCDIPFATSTYMYTIYTGSAVSLLDGVTICKRVLTGRKTTHIKQSRKLGNFQHYGHQ